MVATLYATLLTIYTTLLIYTCYVVDIYTYVGIFPQGQVLEALDGYKLSNSTVIHVSYVTPCKRCSAGEICLRITVTISLVPGPPPFLLFGMRSQYYGEVEATSSL